MQQTKRKEKVGKEKIKERLCPKLCPKCEINPIKKGSKCGIIRRQEVCRICFKNLTLDNKLLNEAGRNIPNSLDYCLVHKRQSHRVL